VVRRRGERIAAYCGALVGKREGHGSDDVA
jgi:hypothetical protein